MDAKQKWGLCVPVSICCILLLVGGISLIRGHDHARAANIVSFAGSVLVFVICFLIMKQTCFQRKSSVKTIFDPAPAYQKKWGKEYYSNFQDSCRTKLNQRDEHQLLELNQRDNHHEDGFQAVHTHQTVSKYQTNEPQSAKQPLSPLEFLNYGFKEGAVESDSSYMNGNDTECSLKNSNVHSLSQATDISDLPSYDQAMAIEISNRPYT